MPFSTFQVVKKFKDPSKLVLPDGTQIDANRNNVVVLSFPNDDGVSPAVTYYTNGADLNDDLIAQQAYFIIQSLNVQEAGLAAITLDKISSPIAPDPRLADLQKKQQAYAIASRDAMTQVRNISAEMQALADLKTAEAALSQATVVISTVSIKAK